jgi:hypothetical protein
MAATTLSGSMTRQVLAGQSLALTPGPGNKWPGRVAINFNKNAVDLTTPKVSVIKTMVDDAIMLLTGKSTVGAAWKELFPASLSLQSKIAIKINTVNTNGAGPHWSSVQAITEGLQCMDFNGTKFPAANIILYDMRFGVGMDGLNYTKENFPGCTLEYTTLVNGGDGALNNHKYAATLKNADYLINVFSPRGHSYPPEGSRFTLGFKSHVGTYASEAKNEGPSLHGKLMENLVAMNCTGPVFYKNVLSVCSGILGSDEGNLPNDPASDYAAYAATMDGSIASSAVSSSTIMLSTDPVAIEMQTIKMMRINKSVAYNIDSLPPYLQASAGIAGKMQGTVYNIGIINEKDMDIRRIKNEVIMTGVTEVSRSHARRDGIFVSVAPGRTTFIEFSLPGQRFGRSASISIHGIDGRSVHKQELRVLGELNQYCWDNRGMNGAAVGPGMYIIRVACGEVRISSQFTLLF